jgi:hypothetical protein
VWRTRHAVITHSGDDRNPYKAIDRSLALVRNHRPLSGAGWRILQISKGRIDAMRTLRFLSITTAVAGSLFGTATAAELSGAEIKELLSGKTLYLDFAASITGTNGSGVIYYAPDGSVLYKTPKGDLWHGTLAFKDNTSCIDWKEKPNNACTKYDKQGNTITLINTTTGEVRGKIVKTAPGNAENLSP